MNWRLLKPRNCGNLLCNLPNELCKISEICWKHVSWKKSTMWMVFSSKQVKKPHSVCKSCLFLYHMIKFRILLLTFLMLAFKICDFPDTFCIKRTYMFFYLISTMNESANINYRCHESPIKENSNELRKIWVYPIVCQ